MYYLNSSSTAYKDTHEFNPSDLAYPEVMEKRSELGEFEVKIKRLVHAPINAKVIFNSGATESIANCIFWAKSYFPHGTIWGSSFDHASVGINCENMNMKYSTKHMPDDCAALFITHVNPKSGELFNVSNIANRMKMIHYLSENTTSSLFNGFKMGRLGYDAREYENYRKDASIDELVAEHSAMEKENKAAHPDSEMTGGDVVELADENIIAMNRFKKSPSDVPSFLAYRPLMFLDASQSIGKTPVYMDKWNLNAVFFSLHKIGGNIGTGVLVIDDTRFAPFKPLVAGFQQGGLRGGTYSIDRIIEPFSNMIGGSVFDEQRSAASSYEYGINDSEQPMLTSDSVNILTGGNTEDGESLHTALRKTSESERVKTWNYYKQYFESKGLNVYTPQRQHLHNTLLISVGNSCPLGCINALAQKNIYVGNVSACTNEKQLNEQEKTSSTESTETNLIDTIQPDEGADAISGGAKPVVSAMSRNSVDSISSSNSVENFIRISFSSPNDLNKSVADSIIKEVKNIM